MTEPQPIEDAEVIDETPPLDLHALIAAAEETPRNESFGTPNFEASREPRRPLFGGKTKTDDKRNTRVKAKVTIPNRKGQFIEPLTELYGFIGFGLMPLDPTCAVAIMQAAPKCAEAWDDLAYKNQAVRRVLHSITQASIIGQLAAAHMPIILAILSHHVKGFDDKMAGLAGSLFASGVESELREQTENDDDDN